MNTLAGRRSSESGNRRSRRPAASATNPRHCAHTTSSPLPAARRHAGPAGWRSGRGPGTRPGRPKSTSRRHRCDATCGGAPSSPGGMRGSRRRPPAAGRFAMESPTTRRLGYSPAQSRSRPCRRQGSRPSLRTSPPPDGAAACGRCAARSTVPMRCRPRTANRRRPGSGAWCACGRRSMARMRITSQAGAVSGMRSRRTRNRAPARRRPLPPSAARCGVRLCGVRLCRSVRASRRTGGRRYRPQAARKQLGRPAHQSRPARRSCSHRAATRRTGVGRLPR
jgi:hypothetical protein